MDFLARLTEGAGKLPFHVARKKVPYLDDNGQTVQPAKENALKFERFIFDVLPLAERWLVMETSHREEFAPLKNAEGADSPEAVEAGAEQPGRRLADAGRRRGAAQRRAATPAVPLEISPLFALDAEELAARVDRGTRIDGPTYFDRDASQERLTLLRSVANATIIRKGKGMLHAMIMAGGGGTRFWPRSRQQRPKQFLALGGDRTLLQQAMDRIEGLLPAEHAWVITGQAYQAETARQLPQLPADHIVGEPCGRDTAACIGLGAALIARRDPSAIMLVTPADHVIEPVHEFERAAHVAAAMAEEHPSALVTFGIPPTFPSTGYGYIHRGPEVGQRQGVSVFRVQAFEEKPPADRAEQLRRLRRVLLEQRHLRLAGRHGAGGTAATAAEAARRRAAHRRRLGHAAARRRAAPANTRRCRRSASTTPSWSTPARCWWSRRRTAGTMSAAGWPWNACTRRTPTTTPCWPTHCGLKTNHCVIVGDAGRLIATIGVENLLIVQDGDATLVADRRDEGTVKQLVELLKKKGLEQYL